jgi:hypothetical protein
MPYTETLAHQQLGLPHLAGLAAARQLKACKQTLIMQMKQLQNLAHVWGGQCSAVVTGGGLCVHAAVTSTRI